MSKTVNMTRVQSAAVVFAFFANFCDYSSIGAKLNIVI